MSSRLYWTAAATLMALVGVEAHRADQWRTAGAVLVLFMFLAVRRELTEEM